MEITKKECIVLLKAKMLRHHFHPSSSANFKESLRESNKNGEVVGGIKLELLVVSEINEKLHYVAVCMLEIDFVAVLGAGGWLLWWLVALFSQPFDSLFIDSSGNPFLILTVDANLMAKTSRSMVHPNFISPP
ncbi:hypothetical protein RJT34_21820 [Clitoria ternatea]|uniref:Uncharacterized protein n=1 Tax=Clitoria ternatea TaxID=43366 RepID=A0AAN9IVF9_CLITE